MSAYYSGRRKLYRSRDGEILGVCKGIAEWREFPVSAVRLIFVLLVLFGGMSIWVYFILALILPVEPEYRSRRQPRYRSTDDVEDEFNDLKERAGKMEEDEFDREKDWDNRFYRK